MHGLQAAVSRLARILLKANRAPPRVFGRELILERLNGAFVQRQAAGSVHSSCALHGACVIGCLLLLGVMDKQ